MKKPRNKANAREVRSSFWFANPQFNRVSGRTQNQYPDEVRTAFVNWVDALQKDGWITNNLADSITL